MDKLYMDIHKSESSCKYYPLHYVELLFRVGTEIMAVKYFFLNNYFIILLYNSKLLNIDTAVMGRYSVNFDLTLKWIHKQIL